MGFNKCSDRVEMIVWNYLYEVSHNVLHTLRKDFSWWDHWNEGLIINPNQLATVHTPINR